MFGKKRPIFTKINDDIILIHQELMRSMNFNTCNSFILKLNESDYAIIDPGCSKKKLNKTLIQNNIDFSSIKYLYLTHGHSDHVNLVDYVKEKNPKIKTFIHPLELPYVESAKEYCEMLFPMRLMQGKEKFSEFINSIKYYTMPNSNLTLHPSFKMVFDTWNLKDRTVDNKFKDGDILPGGVQVIHAPGHTSGMCMFYREKDKVLFSSDIHLSKAGATVNGDTGSIQDLKESINKVIKLVEDGSVKIILPSHGNNAVSDNLKERVQEFYASITRKENALLEILQNRGNITLEEISEETFKKYIQRFKNFMNLDIYKDTIIIAEASELMGNLNVLRELELQNKVKKTIDENFTRWSLN